MSRTSELKPKCQASRYAYVTIPLLAIFVFVVLVVFVRQPFFGLYAVAIAIRQLLLFTRVTSWHLSNKVSIHRSLWSPWIHLRCVSWRSLGAYCPTAAIFHSIKVIRHVFTSDQCTHVGGRLPSAQSVNISRLSYVASFSRSRPITTERCPIPDPLHLLALFYGSKSHD